MAKVDKDDFYAFGTKFSAKADVTIPEEDQDDETGFPPVEEEPKKKPKGDGEDETIDDASAFSRAVKSRKASYKKEVKVSVPNQELIDSTRDAFRALENEVNAREKDPYVVDNGSVIPMISMIKPLAGYAYSIISKINTNVESDALSIDSRRLLMDIRNQVAEITNAVTNADVVSMTMSIRNLSVILYAANEMIHGEANLVNGHGHNDQSDLWRFFHRYTPVRADGTVAAPDGDVNTVARHRNMTGDNAISPDVTIVKPIFLVFPCQDLKRKLVALDIDCQLIGDHEDDNDMGILGHYSIPTVFNGNNRQGGLVIEEDRQFAGLGYMTMGDDEGTHLNAPNFTWSHNGTQDLRQKCPAAYRAQNDAFVAEIRDLIIKAKETGVQEINPSIAFCLVLTGWMNGAFKAMVEANAINVKDEISKGISLNEKRFIAANNTDILAKIITELGIGYDGDKKQTQYASMLDAVIDQINRKMSRVMGGKFHYSEKAYALIRNDFKTMTYEATGADEYYIGDIKFGSGIIKITVAPKLYLPVDASVTEYEEIRIPVNVARPKNTLAGVVTHPFNFIMRLNRTHWVLNRNVNENDLILNISLFHAVCGMTNAEYAGFVDHFYERNTMSVGNAEVPFANIIGTDGVGYARYLSAIAPFYEKSKVLGVSPVHQVNNPGDDCMIRYPMLDQLGNFNAYRNRDTAWRNQYAPYVLGDYIKACFNYHADWSWIEAGIVAAGIMSGYVTTQNEPQFNGTEAYAYNPVAFSPVAADGFTPITTYLRQARAFMDAERYNFGFKRFNSEFITKQPAPTRSGKIVRADIEKAFRWSLYNRTHYYLIDNTVKDNFAAKNYWIESRNGVLTRIFKCIEEGTKVNITEKDALSKLLSKEYCDGSLLIYDNYHAENARIGYTPENIPGTELVGYRMTNGAGADSNVVRDRVCRDVVEDNVIRRYLGVNDYVYISDDFYPETITYTVVVPTNTTHAYAVIGDAAVGMNNIRFFDVAINFMYRTGMIAGNADGARMVTQMMFGINQEVDTLDLVRAADAENNHETQGYGGVNYHTTTGVAAGEPAAESFVSSWRYPQYIVAPAYGVFTGIPAHIEEANALAAYDIISKVNAKRVADVFGTIIDNYNSAVQTYHNDKSGKANIIFALRQGLNNNIYGAQAYDFIVTMPARSIINAIEMEDK